MPLTLDIGLGRFKLEFTFKPSPLALAFLLLEGDIQAANEKKITQLSRSVLMAISHNNDMHIKIPLKNAIVEHISWWQPRAV